MVRRIDDFLERWRYGTEATVRVFSQLTGWRRGSTLGRLLVHQTHHRGQMTVLMRQAGLTVPGVYGPAREEWAAFGMPPQE